MLKNTILSITFLSCMHGFPQNITKQINAIQSRPLESYSWDLSTLYSNEQDVEKEIKEIQLLIGSMEELKRLQLNSSSDLLFLMDRVSDVRKRAAKLVVYGALISNLDKTSESAQKIYDQALEVEDKVESEVAFMKHKVADLAPARIALWMKEEPRLQAHIKRLNRIAYEREYFLDPKSEGTLKKLNRFRLQSGRTYQALLDSDLDWPVYNFSGRDIVLDIGQYFNLRSNSDDASKDGVRKFHEYMARYEDLLAIQLTNRIEMDLQLANLRGIESSIDAEFFIRDGFPIGSVQNFRNAAQKHAGVLSEFVRIKSRLLGNDQTGYADLYQSLPSFEDTYPIGRSVEILLNATKRFGTAYQQRLVEVFNDSVLHFANLPTKRRMWAIYPPVGGAKPYTIMSYNDSFLASNVFARAMVGNLAQHHYEPDTRDDPPVYNNGVIYTGGLLHYEYLIDQAQSPEEKLFYLIEAANRIWNSFFKYSIYATFEFEIEERLKAGKYLTGEEVSQIYYDVLMKFFDNDIQIPEHYRYEWMTIAQPFYTYEHQYWPVAIAAASVILDRIEEDEKIQNLLIGKTETQWDRSHQILKAVGIDMGEESTYMSIATRMKKYMDDMKNLSN